MQAICIVFPFYWHMQKTVGRIVCRFALEGFAANRAVRTNKYTLSTVGTQIWLPYGYFQREVSLLYRGSTHRKCAICGEQTNRNAIALPPKHGTRYFVDETIAGNLFDGSCNSTYLTRDRHTIQMIARLIDCLVIDSHHLTTFFTVCFFNRLFDLLNRLVGLHDIRCGKETGLHDRIDAFA